MEPPTEVRPAPGVKLAAACPDFQWRDMQQMCMLQSRHITMLVKLGATVYGASMKAWGTQQG